MRDHFLYGKFFDFHSRGPFLDHFGPHGCRPHGHGHHGHGPHGHGPHGHGPHGHGPHGHGPHGHGRHGHGPCGRPHGPHHHGKHGRFGCHGPHKEVDSFGPRGFNPWDSFRHFDRAGRPGHFDRSGRPGHFDRPGPSFFGRGDSCNRRGGCFGRRGHEKQKSSEEQTFLFRGVVIEQDKRPNSV